MKNILVIFLMLLGVTTSFASNNNQKEVKDLVTIDTVLVSGQNQYALGTLTKRCSYTQILSWAEANNFEFVESDDLEVASTHISGFSVLGISNPQNLEFIDGRLWIWVLESDGSFHRCPDTQKFGGHWFTNAPYKVLLKVQ